MLRLLFTCLISSLILSGCAPPTFYKPGATQQEFVSTKYGCERDVRQSGNFGGGIVGAIEQQQFFNRCMAAQGWNLQDSSEQESVKTSNTAKADKVKLLVAQRQICFKSARDSDPEFSLIASHMVPVEAPGFTILQKANTSLATSAEAKVLLRYLEKADSCRSEFTNALRGVYPNGAAHLATVYASSSRVWLQVIRKETTWGGAATQIEQESEIAEAKAKLIQG